MIKSIFDTVEDNINKKDESITIINNTERVLQNLAGNNTNKLDINMKFSKVVTLKVSWKENKKKYFKALLQINLLCYWVLREQARPIRLLKW